MVTDITQLLLTIVLVVSTIFLVIIGVQVVGILKELKSILTRANKVVDGIERVGMSLDGSFKELGGFMMGFKTIMQVVSAFTSRKRDK